MNSQSNFHWAKFLVFFFYLFHLKKIEFTSEMLTHARLCKVLACVTLKKRRQFLLFFFFLFLDWGFFLWMVGRTSSNLFLEANLVVLCVLHICSPSPAAGTLWAPSPEVVVFLEGLEGKENSRGQGASAFIS